MYDLAKYLIILLIGYFLAKKHLIPNKIGNKTGELLMVSLYLMLFFLGYRVGANKELMANIHKLGLKSFIFALLAITFSATAVGILLKGKGKKEENKGDKK